MNNKELIKEFEEKFGIMKKELKFKSSLEDLDKVFFLKDFILKEGYVSNSLSRMVCARIVDTYFGWTNCLHSLVIPNPSSMINITECKMFEDKEKEDITRLMTKIMAFVRKNTLIGLTHNKAEEAKFIDNALKLWNKVSPELINIIKKVTDSWNEKTKSDK